MDFELGHKEKDFNSSTEGRRDSISLGAEERKGREWFDLIEVSYIVVEKQEIRFQGRLKR